MKCFVVLIFVCSLFISCGAKHDQAVTTNAEGANFKSAVLSLDSQLQAAIIADDPSVVESLLEQGANANKVVGNKRDSYLHGAVAAGALEIVALLIEYGADPHAKNGEGMSVFDQVGADSQEMQEILSGNSITLETHNRLLLLAVKNNRVPRARYNLEKGGSPNVLDERKSSLLMLSVNEKNLEMVTLLANWPGIQLNYKVRKTALGMAKDIQLKDRRAGQDTVTIDTIIALLVGLGAI